MGERAREVITCVGTEADFFFIAQLKQLKSKIFNEN